MDRGTHLSPGLSVLLRADSHPPVPVPAMIRSDVAWNCTKNAARWGRFIAKDVVR